MDYTAINGDLMWESLNLGTTNVDALGSLPTDGLLSLLGWWGIGLIAIGIALIIFFIIALCFVFKKAWYKWYEALISGHNTFLTIVIAGKPGRYFFLLIVPYLVLVLGAGLWWIGSIITSILWIAGFVYLYGDITFSMAKRFKKWFWFSIGLFFLPIIFYPILGFGKAKYTKIK